MLSTPDTDVLVVGYGPVGQVLANLLAQRGHRVTVVERWSRPYPMPRAVSFDSESGRILAAAGVAPALAQIAEPSRDYVWTTAAGQTLLAIDVADPGHCFWPDSTSVYQPGLEEALAGRGAALPSLRVLRGQRAVDLSDRGDEVVVTLAAAGGGTAEAGTDAGTDAGAGAGRSITARWVVGCDGANSFVRERIGSPVTDLGFSDDWLICDVQLPEPREFVPNNLQVCDPRRPTTVVSAGPGHRRWEFMQVPGETREELDRVETAWRLLAPFDVHPGNATLDRHAVYTFRARCAQRWRSGRLLIAGDAAHLMPPFAGQGMCSGFRDAANLAWKLDLVLTGRSDEDLLDTYGTERRAHVQHAILMSVNLGKVICQADPKAAADRDAAMLEARERGAPSARPQSAVHPLTGGAVRRTARNTAVRPAGLLAPQGRVARAGRVGLFDEVVGPGFALLATDGPRGRLDDSQLAFLDDIGASLVTVRPGGRDAAPSADPDAVLDVDDVYLTYLAANAPGGMLVRPDFYVFGGAVDSADLGPLVDALRADLSVPVSY